MATIRKRKHKYQAQVRRSGFPTITKSFHMLKDAQEWSRQMEIQIDRDELTQDRSVLKETTLADLVEKYLREVVSSKKSREVETAILKAFLKHAICKKRLSDLRVYDLCGYRDEKLKTIQPNSLKRQLAPLKHMFEIARTEWSLPLKENPLLQVKLDYVDIKRERRLKDGEYEKLILAAQTRKNPYISKVIIFAIETAMRRGEILALTWNQVDINRRCVTILESKNGHSRTIPLTPKAYVLLQGLSRRKDQVFPLTKDALKMAWGRILKVADIEDLHFHDLRHEAVSRFFEMGLTVPEVASISGHRDTRMLLRYAHANTSTLQAKLEC